MLGMFMKDFYILKNQGKVLLFLVLISFGLVIINSDFTFPILLVAMISSMFSVSTIAYDEYDNGFDFLMTLPNSRKGYAISKYLFSLFAGIVSTVFMTLLVLGFVSMMHKSIDLIEFFVTIITGFFTSQALVGLFIPFNLKYGSEKGRIIMMVMFLVVGMGGYFALETLRGLNVELFSVLNFVVSSPSTFVLVGFATCVIIWLISMLISINVMKKKEF